jgi:hypothetical protein
MVSGSGAARLACFHAPSAFPSAGKKRRPARALLVIWCSFFRVSPGATSVPGIEPLLPQGPVPAQPFIDLGERLGAKNADPPLRLLADLERPWQ